MSSSSTRAFLRRREKFIHVSVPLIEKKVELVPERKLAAVTIPAILVTRSVEQRPGKTRNIGRNAMKRIRNRVRTWQAAARG